MEDFRVVLIRECGCHLHYDVESKPCVTMKCDQIYCRGQAPVEPEFTKMQGRLLVATEQNREDLHNLDHTELASGWLKPSYEHTDSEEEEEVLARGHVAKRRRVHSMCK